VRSNRQSGFLLAGAHEASIYRNNFESLVVKRNDPVSESLQVSSRNVSLMYVIPVIKIGNQREFSTK
jgi:hypothetical protein